MLCLHPEIAVSSNFCLPCTFNYTFPQFSSNITWHTLWTVRLLLVIHYSMNCILPQYNFFAFDWIKNHCHNQICVCVCVCVCVCARNLGRSSKEKNKLPLGPCVEGSQCCCMSVAWCRERLSLVVFFFNQGGLSWGKDLVAPILSCMRFFTHRMRSIHVQPVLHPDQGTGCSICLLSAGWRSSLVPSLDQSMTCNSCTAPDTIHRQYA